MTPGRVLVTGGGGFIGSHLVEHQLRLGRQVTALDLHLERLEPRKADPNLTLVQGDIRDTGLLQEIVPGSEVVFHLASAHLEVNLEDSVFLETNVTAARTLARIGARAGVRRFVHCSSVGVYGPLAQVPADEHTPCRPDIAYEITKLEGERAVLAVAAEENLPTVVLRPAWVYGADCPRTLKLFRALRKKRFLMVGDGRNLRHPVYIDDMLQAFELAATRAGVEGQVFIIAAAEYVTLEKLISTILQVEHSAYRPLKVPLAVMWPVCYAVEGLARLLDREPPFSRRSLKFFTENSAFSIARAREQLGFAPVFDLRQGLEQTRRAMLAATPGGIAGTAG